MINLKSLPAHDGDCFIIQYGEEKKAFFNILVDGGRGQQVVRQLLCETEIINDKNENIDLLILTHIDADHIQGILKLFSNSSFNKNCIKKVLFNSRTLLSQKFDIRVVKDEQLEIVQAKDIISFKQGESLEAYLDDLNIEKMKIVDSYSDPIEINNAVITILTPDEESLRKLYVNWDKEFQNEEVDNPISGMNTDYDTYLGDIIKNKFQEDRAIVNGSSISFILEYDGKRILMLADAHPSSVKDKIEELYGKDEVNFDLVKISHHGSKANTSDELLSHISCEKYLISSNSGNKHGFPHKEALSRIVYNNYSNNRETFFYLNYPNILDGIFTDEEIEKYAINFIEKKNDERVLTICL